VTIDSDESDWENAVDLNEKIAARRKELEIKAKQKEEEQERQAKKIERQAFTNEIARRNENEDIPRVEVQSIAAMSDKQFKKALEKAAIDRMTSAEKAIVALLFIFSLLGFFVTWWLGLSAFIACGVYLNVKKMMHKNEILAEAKHEAATSKMDR
jgi:hypothetical protein